MFSLTRYFRYYGDLRAHEEPVWYSLSRCSLVLIFFLTSCWDVREEFWMNLVCSWLQLWHIIIKPIMVWLWLLMSLILCTLRNTAITCHPHHHHHDRHPLSFAHTHICSIFSLSLMKCSLFSNISVWCSLAKTVKLGTGFLFSDRCQVVNEFVLAADDCEQLHSHSSS